VLIPTQHTLIDAVHDSRIRHDAHEMGRKTAVERVCAFFSNDEAESLQKAAVLHDATRSDWLP